ncbi:MAG TPA: bifunctional riboflavin kinase/FAD synthetase [Terracidiphilus sp.]|nr:bifunctional riboflavin kinase/FAD synthetase [Terracidiphilus sp.]
MNDPDRAVQIYRSLTEVPARFGPSVAAIGNFDGVHRGHQEILGGLVREARSTGARSIAVTFDPHPEHFLRPQTAPKLLTPGDEKIRLLAATGIDAILVIPFDKSFSSLSAREFVSRVLVDLLGVKSVHEGSTFRFGRRAEAGVNELADFGKEFGFEVRVHGGVRVHGLDVSSSAVRNLVTAGDMKRARWMLARPFAVRSTQARGRGIGTRLLVPTVNLADYTGLLPAFGVYVTRLAVGANCFQAVTNVGNRPTFGEASFAVESHILDFEPVDLTADTPLELSFLLRLRPEIEWPSPDTLKAQIMKDVARARRYFRLQGVMRAEEPIGSDSL